MNNIHSHLPPVEVYAQWVRYTPEGDRETVRLEFWGEDRVLYAIGPDGRKRNHGGRISKREAYANAEHWVAMYEGSDSFRELGFMRVV